jgi:hypothetical protein
MKKKTSLERIHEEIERVRRQLLELGPIHPGSISPQYHACGNPACRCHDPGDPKKHGPYNKLTYCHRGKSGCRFVRDEHFEQISQRLRNYKTFRALVDRWIELSIQAAAAEFFARTPAEASDGETAPRD